MATQEGARDAWGSIATSATRTTAPGPDMQATRAHRNGRELAPAWLNARLGRRRFFVYQVALLLLYLPILATADAAAQALGTDKLTVIIAVIMVGTLLQFPLLVRRCHDFNARGWWTLLLFLNLIGAVFYLLLLLIPGSTGENRYGTRAGHGA